MCISLKNNLGLAVLCRKYKVKIRVTWHFIFSKKKSLSLSIIIPSSFHSASLHILHSISLHSTSFFFQFIHSISFPPIKSLSGLFHSDKFVLIIFVQAEKYCCRFRSSYQVSTANTLCLCNQSNSVSKRKKFTVRSIIIKEQQGYIAPTRLESNQKLATITNKEIKCKRMKVCSKFLINSLISFMHGFQIVVGVT